MVNRLNFPKERHLWREGGFFSCDFSIYVVDSPIRLNSYAEGNRLISITSFLDEMLVLDCEQLSIFIGLKVVFWGSGIVYVSLTAFLRYIDFDVFSCFMIRTFACFVSRSFEAELQDRLNIQRKASLDRKKRFFIF